MNTAVSRMKSMGMAKRIRVTTYARREEPRAMGHPSTHRMTSADKDLQKREGCQGSTVPGNGRKFAVEVHGKAELREQRVRGRTVGVPIRGLEHRLRPRQARRGAVVPGGGRGS